MKIIEGERLDKYQDLTRGLKSLSEILIYYAHLKKIFLNKRKRYFPSWFDQRFFITLSHICVCMYAWVTTQWKLLVVKQGDTCIQSSFCKVKCLFFKGWGSPRSVVANVLDCDIAVSEFELQLCYYVHVRSNTFQKSFNPFFLPAMG